LSWTKWKGQPKSGSHQRVNCVHDRFGLLIDFVLHEEAKLALHDFGKLNFECFEAASGWVLATVFTTTVTVNM
jgi:hypothetical protein